MSDKGIEKLKENLAELEAMAADMAHYLHSDVLFGKMPNDMPRLTLGGYLMRQQRLQALENLLAPEDVERVEKITESVQDIFRENIVVSERKAQEELEARMRQWRAYLLDVHRDAADYGANYAVAVETRAMAAALMDFLSQQPYHLPTEVSEALATLDMDLQSVFKPGDFIWPEVWAEAYPSSNYWWLYGRPVD